MLVEYLKRFHQVGVGRVRNWLIQYIQDFPHNYSESAVKCPGNWTALQAELRVICGWLCKTCGFRSKSWKRVRVHGNNEHGLKRGSVDKKISEV